MDKLNWLYGFLIGIAAAMLGTYLFITAFTAYDFSNGIAVLRYTGMLGNVIKLGALLNLGLFFLLLYLKKDTMAKGVILATLFLGILTLFV